jgi:hypothetical protein
MAASSKSGQPTPLAAAELVPEHLLDGDEIVLFAIKPSLWFVVFTSARWLAGLIVVLCLARWIEALVPGINRPLLARAVLALAGARVGFAVLEWASRSYVLTNRRVMRIRGIFNITIFECALLQIQNTFLTLTWYERLLGLGSISFATAGSGTAEATWSTVAHPLEVHEQVRAAINRARGQGR